MYVISLCVYQSKRWKKIIEKEKEGWR